jgi:hypothetical protein
MGMKKAAMRRQLYIIMVTESTIVDYVTGVTNLLPKRMAL